MQIFDPNNRFYLAIDTPMIKELPNDAVRLTGKCMLNTGTKIHVVTVQIDQDDVNAIGRVYLARLRRWVKEKIADGINAGARSQVVEQEWQHVKRYMQCTDEDISLCLMQTTSKLDRIKELLNEPPAEIVGFPREAS